MQKTTSNDANQNKMEKHTVRIYDHNTSISLESIFWHYLNAIAKDKNISTKQLIEEIDLKRTGNLSSAIRVFILNYFIDLNNYKTTK